MTKKRFLLALYDFIIFYRRGFTSVDIELYLHHQQRWPPASLYYLNISILLWTEFPIRLCIISGRLCQDEETEGFRKIQKNPWHAILIKYFICLKIKIFLSSLSRQQVRHRGDRYVRYLCHDPVLPPSQASVVFPPPEDHSDSSEDDESSNSETDSDNHIRGRRLPNILQC